MRQSETRTERQLDGQTVIQADKHIDWETNTPLIKQTKKQIGSERQLDSSLRLKVLTKALFPG